MLSNRDGILLIDKDSGESSFSTVKRVKRILGVKKAGHAGTLDPFATGLLIVLLGEGTKLSQYLMAHEKRYWAKVRLGIETSTMDPTGTVVRTSPVPDLDPKYVEEKILGFLGEIEQRPPAFSAVKYKGQRAYKMARKGIRVELKKRRVLISHIEVIHVDLPDVTIVLTCSPGTYVRSLAAEIGNTLGVGGHLLALRRLSVGPFKVEDALRLAAGDVAELSRAVSERIIPLKEALPDMKELQVDGSMAERIRKGYQPTWDELSGAVGDFFDTQVKVVKGSELVAFLKTTRNTNRGKVEPKILRVFN
ncbi:MAG: tRNA pseudouridine(55) synthase TruB [Deltaproteobacteria bacterium]|nr:MAG: tRNA pseudouridine(55) synthase TruB [Deltaproteobacteria bacterium]